MQHLPEFEVTVWQDVYIYIYTYRYVHLFISFLQACRPTSFHAAVNATCACILLKHPPRSSLVCFASDEAGPGSAGFFDL